MKSMIICEINNDWSSHFTFSGNERIVELLLKNGANVNKANTIDGNTALHDAALNGTKYT